MNMTKATFAISNETLNTMVALAEVNGISYEFFEGCLQDNVIFYDAEDIHIDGISATYIIVKEKYVNVWSSELVAILTDSFEEVQEFEEVVNMF
ncbi:hypothetical protein [Bacillus phage SBSphiJ5]|nr:hypothetical protein [Bacillus phage SBSphiJ5]